MANTDVRITEQGDAFVPDVRTVPIVAGDTVTFYADPDSQTNLCMTVATASILSPQPDLTVTIAAGNHIGFTFSSASPGNYCVVTQAPDWPYPSNISCGPDIRAVLSIVVGLEPVYSGPTDDPQT